MAFAHFQGVNVPIVADFKLLTACRWSRRWEERHTISSSEQFPNQPGLTTGETVGKKGGGEKRFNKTNYRNSTTTWNLQRAYSLPRSASSPSQGSFYTSLSTPGSHGLSQLQERRGKVNRAVGSGRAVTGVDGSRAFLSAGPLASLSTGRHLSAVKRTVGGQPSAQKVRRLSR